MAVNDPKHGDSTNRLLWKLLTIFGGTPAPADGNNRLVQKLVSTASASSSGIETLTYAASVALDFSTGQDKSIALTGNITFTTAGLGAGEEISIRIVADGSLRTFTFPAGWTFIGALPADIAASKTGILSLKSYGTTDADVVAAYSVEA